LREPQDELVRPGLPGGLDDLVIGRPRTSSVNRTVTDLPLGLDYEVIEDDKQVRVLRVWSLV
jgi:hypothetical protein